MAFVAKSEGLQPTPIAPEDLLLMGGSLLKLGIKVGDDLLAKVAAREAGKDSSKVIENNFYRDGLDPTFVKESGGYKWPSNNGFAGDPTKQTLQPGTIVDRYGSTSGKFFAPDGTPFDMRALPNSSLAEPYYRFEVIKPFQVDAGKAAPWVEIGKPGGGMQFYTGEKINIEKLIKDGYIRIKHD